jgi:AraC-like DNA-binding protein
MSRGKPFRDLVSPTVQTFRAFEAIFNNFRYYTDMSCFLVTKDKPNQWLCLQPPPKSFGIVNYENRFGQDRDHYNQANFKRLLTDKHPICSRFSGFHNFFVPVLCKGKCIAFITSGFFSKSIPTREELELQWKSWTGRFPAPDDTDFKGFVLNALNMPLLDGPQARAHRELLEMAAALLSGEGDPDGIASRATELNHKVFTRWKLNAEWPRKALGLEIVGSDQSWPDKRFGENDMMVTKMRRMPTVAMALLLVDEQDRALDDVDAMIRQKRLEREGFFHARRLGETVSFPVGDEGLAFLTSPRPGSNPTQAKLQLREKARSISERMGKLFHTQALIGIGSILPEGEGLNASYQEALLALQWAIHQDRKQVSYDEIAPLEINTRSTGTPWPDAQDLTGAYLRGAKAEKVPALDRYIRDVIHQAAGRVDLARVHLISTLSLYSAQLEGKLLLPSGRLSGLLRDWIIRLEKSRATHELIGAFKEALGAFAQFSLDPSTAELAATVKDLKVYVSGHFRSPLTAGHAARQMGVSPSSLHRYVRKWMGMGFNQYVQQVRLEEAKRMLRTSRFSVARIAQECGFSSSGYFIRSFKKKTRKTPLQFRDGPNP